MDLDKKVKGLSFEQKTAVNICALGGSIFMTGSAGTGKSHALKAVISHLHHKNKRVLVTATTGIAAVNIGGCTLYTAFSIHPTMVSNYVSSGAITRKSKRWSEIDALVIDEISMCSPNLFMFLDAHAKYSTSSSKPFGGIQLILSGDYFQLPPVEPKRKPNDMQFVFETPIYQRIFGSSGNGSNVVFRTQHRQSQSDFIKLLERFRVGKLEPADCKYLCSLRAGLSERPDHLAPTCLFGRRHQVEDENIKNMLKLNAKDWENPLSISVDTTKQALSIKVQTKIRNEVLKNLPISRRIRVGSQVMLSHNLDVGMMLCNGSRGVVTALQDGFPVVKFSLAGVTIMLKYHSWVFDYGPGIVVTAKAVPLRLAYAMTIHKSQGQSIDFLTVDLTHCWEPGMAYTALSRATSTKGLAVVGFNPECVFTNPRVVTFYKQMKVSA